MDNRYTMLGKVFEKIFGLPQDFLGSLWDLVEKMGGENGRRWFKELNHFLRREPTWVKRLLKLVRTVDLPPIEELRIDDYIESGEIDGVQVVFRESFKKVFGGKVEEDIPAKTLKVNQLVDRSPNDPIIAELGGKEVATIKLAQVVAFVRQQSRLKETVWFVFYVEDDKGTVWAIHCSWYAYRGSWGFGACPTTDRGGWREGGFIVSCDSDSQSS